jgi:hypothetical protein
MRVIPPVAAVAAALLLAACSSQACTDIGCGPEVLVDVRELTAGLEGEQVSTTLCVDGLCDTRVLTPDEVTLFGSLPAGTQQTAAEGAQVEVELTVSRDGVEVVDSTVRATLSRFQPNGPSCEPVCLQTSLVLTDGALVAS